MLMPILGIVAAYLLGSIATAVWVGKIFYGVDVREHGSGNAGATNTIRVLGTKPGVSVLLLDALKGAAAVCLAGVFSTFQVDSDAEIGYKVALGMVAVIGHIFPIYVGFRGGKGIATLLGVVIALQPTAALIAIILFAIIFLATRYVSLGSILAAISYPFIVYFYLGLHSMVYVGFAAFVAILVPLTHIKNIKRLLKGEENKLSFGKKK